MPVSHPDSNSCLLDRLSQFPAEQPLLHVDTRHLNVGEVVARAVALRSDSIVSAGKTLVLHRLSPLDQLLRLIAGDGYCSRILLLPTNLDRELAVELITKSLQLSPLTDRTEWLLTTSGTTGIPKLVGHTLTSLCHRLKRDFATGRKFRWGLVYDLSRFAGLQVALQALFSGSELVLTAPDDFNTQLESLLSAEVNALSATPTYWRKLLMEGRIKECPLRQITLGGEITDKKLLDTLRQHFPSARIAHIYASTEAGVGFSVSDGQAGFPLTFLTEGIGNTLLRINEAGCLCVRSVVTPPGVPCEDLDADGYINSHDLVEVRGSRVYFSGRDSGTINVGGNKVYPERVEGVIREIPGVWDVRVFSKKNPFTGEIVVAEVVQAETAQNEPLRNAILTHCQTQLEPWQVPALIYFVTQLDSMPSGKLSRTGASS